MLDKTYVIHHRRPYRFLLFSLLTLIIIAVLAWFWAQQWLARKTEDLTTLQSQHQQLLAENQRLTEQNQSLMAKLEDINQMQLMQQATDAQLQADLEAMQNQVISLNKELLFYQNITQGTASSELQVRELHLRSSTEDPALFHYRIVITQGKKITKAIKGVIELSLNLAGDAKPASRTLNEHTLKLRHVQVIEGTLRLAENEQPESLLVQLKQDKKTLAKRTFAWEIEPAP